MYVRGVQRKDKPGWSNKALAIDFAKKMDARLNLGEVGISVKAGLTLKAYAEIWLKYIDHTRKPLTREDYQKRYKPFGIMPTRRCLMSALRRKFPSEFKRWSSGAVEVRIRWRRRGASARRR